MARLTRNAIEIAIEESDTLEIEFEWLAGVEPLVPAIMPDDEHDSGRYDCYCCCPCHNSELYAWDVYA
jgi:hypothetical protein